MTKPYAKIEYHVWTSMSNVFVSIQVETDAIAVLGETLAVKEALWHHMFHLLPELSPTAKVLRMMGKSMQSSTGYTLEICHASIKRTVCNSVRWKKITIEGEA